MAPSVDPPLGDDRVRRGRAGATSQPSRRPGREALGGGAAVDDPVGGHALQRADRAPVVAVLGVVVVLDHVAVDVARPADELVAPVGREHHAGRALVRRGDDDGPRRCAAQPVDDEPLAVDLDAHEADAQRRRARRGPRRSRGPRPRRPSRPVARRADGDEAEAVAEAVAHDDAVGIGAHPPHPGEVVGERSAQLGAGHADRRSRGRASGKVWSAARVARAHAVRGKAARSGRPGRKSTSTGGRRRSRPGPRPAPGARWR